MSGTRPATAMPHAMRVVHVVVPNPMSPYAWLA